MVGVVRVHEKRILGIPGTITEAAVMTTTVGGAFRHDGLEGSG